MQVHASKAKPAPGKSTSHSRPALPIRASVHAAGAAEATQRACACGGGCPRCVGISGVNALATRTSQPTVPSANSNARLTAIGSALENDADEAARKAMSAAQLETSLPPAQQALPGRRQPSGSGQALAQESRDFFEPRYQQDLSHVRIHSDVDSARRARDVRASAFTFGGDIFFARDRYEPATPAGARLLAHELAHVVQQTASPGPGSPALRASAPIMARSVDDWLARTVDLHSFSYTQLLGELDELNQFLQRQTASTDETARIEQASASIRAELGRREGGAAARTPGPREKRRSRRSPAPDPSTEVLPERYPRILAEMTSVAYTDPSEMRAEYDLIMQWLAHGSITASQRRILVAERRNLAPQLQADRERVAGERHAARVRAALTPVDEDDSRALDALARTIAGITADPANPAAARIHDGNEQITISREQAEQLRRGLASELSRAARRIDSSAGYYWARYQSQSAIDRDSPIIAGISGWLADVKDLGAELSMRHAWITARLHSLQDMVARGRLVEAAGMLPQVERVHADIRMLACAYYEGQIEGAETAARGLELTRDTSFAIAGSIAAVLAAPMVAGLVGTGGLGLGGVSATAATTLGTGTVVGTGMAIVRGGSAATGTGFAGGSPAEIAAAFRGEGARGFREGLMSGAAAGAARILGPALGVGAQVGGQALRRIAADALINGTSAMVDVLRQDGSAIAQAARAAAIAAVASAPGALLGGSSSPLVRHFVAPFTAGATAYAGALANGASSQQALEAAGVALATNLAMTRATHGAAEDAALVERGRSMGKSARGTAIAATRRASSVVAAVMIGTADALPPVRSGYGGSSITTPANTGASKAARAVTTEPRSQPEGAHHATTATAQLAASNTPATAVAPASTSAGEQTPSTPATATHPEGALVAQSPVHSTQAIDPHHDLNFEASFSETAQMQNGERSELLRTGNHRSDRVRSLDSVALSAEQRRAAIALHGQRLGSTLDAVWNASTNPRELADIQTIRAHAAAGRMDEARALARAAFNRHRSRFWRRVRGSTGLMSAFTDAGMEFMPGAGAPVYRDPGNGEVLDRLTLEHSTRLADAPTRALEAVNLQTVLGDENSYHLEAIRRLDPFQ